MSYAEAHFPVSRVVAGVRLQPLSMGHALLLSRMGCPLIPGGKPTEPQPGDVAMLLWICSRSWRAAVAKIGSRYSSWWRTFVAGRVLARQPQVLREVDSYLQGELEGPKLKPGSHGRGNLYSPTLALIKVAAMVDLGLSEEAILDRPLRITLWEVAVAGERRGDVEIAPTLDAFQFLLAASKAAQSASQEEVPHGQ